MKVVLLKPLCNAIVLSVFIYAGDWNQNSVIIRNFHVFLMHISGCNVIEFGMSCIS